VELGAVVLLPLALAHAFREHELAGRVALVCGITAAAVIASGLVAAAGPTVNAEALKNLVFLAIAAFCVRGSIDVGRVGVALAVGSVILGIGAAYSVLVHPTALFQLQELGPTDAAAPRAGGLFGEPNFFALSLAAALPFGLRLITDAGWRRMLGILAAVAIPMGILASGSRAGLLVAGLAAVLWAWSSLRGAARLAVLLPFACALALVPLFSAQVSDSAGREVGGRYTENSIAIAMFADHPLLGVGPGQYPALYRDYARRIGDDPRYEREPHSLFLQIAAEQGLVGLLAFLAAALVVGGYARARQLWADPGGRAVLIALLTYLAGSIFLHGSDLRILFILVGLVFAAGAGERPRWPVGPKQQPTAAPE
jgi:O-antigen ligase